MNLKPFLYTTNKKLVRHLPTILTIAAIGGVIATGALAVKGTTRAVEILDFEKKKKRYELKSDEEELTPVEVVKAVYKEYFPTVLVGAATISCILSANSIHWRRLAAVQGVYVITETAYKEYRDKVTSMLGERKNQEIRDEIAQDKIDANPVGKNEIIITGHGDNLCYDIISGRYFKSDIEKLRRVENQLNKIMFTEMWIGLNELYSEIGLPSISIGADIGWDVDEPIDFIFSSKLTEDGEPCLVVGYVNNPRPYSAVR